MSPLHVAYWAAGFCVLFVWLPMLAWWLR